MNAIGMTVRTLKIDAADNIEAALTDLPKGGMVNIAGTEHALLDDIPSKHKFATKDLAAGEDVIMYGVLVGKAISDIRKGERISTKNIRHASDGYRLGKRNTAWNAPDISKWKNRSFQGYHRKDGSVGIANHWLIIPLVFCENKNVQVIHEAFVKELGYRTEAFAERRQVAELVSLYRSGKTAEEILASDLPCTGENAAANQRLFRNIDGIKLLTHTLGCGGTKDDTVALCGLLAGYITHANVAGATVLSLGCQNAQVELLKDEIAKRDRNFSKPLIVLEQQRVGSETVLLQEAIKRTFTALMEANKQEREPAPLSKLCIGLECGGSDGFSGISANPALGHASDLLVALGASVILSEFPELCGVEQQLIDRCMDESIANRFIELMNAYHSRARSVGSGFDSNPSAGNIIDGLITDAIKSAGAAKKGGSSPVTDVLDYPGKITRPGLNLLCTPGSDIESTTAEVGAGATLVVFTTGLGTPTGNPVAPVVKVSTSTKLFRRMNDIIDIDAGTVITGEESPEQVGERILEQIIAIAGGRQTVKAVVSGHDDFIPWKRGISL